MLQLESRDTHFVCTTGKKLTCDYVMK